MVTLVTYRCTQVVQWEGHEKLAPYWVSLSIDFFYDRFPTLILLTILSRWLYV